MRAYWRVPIWGDKIHVCSLHLVTQMYFFHALRDNCPKGKFYRKMQAKCRFVSTSSHLDVRLLRVFWRHS